VTEAAEDDPTELVAVIEKIVKGRTPVGVPKIIQVEESIEAQAGKDGDVEQFVTGAPLLSKAVGVTDMTAPTVPLVPKEPR
jgi:hypothetical protein